MKIRINESRLKDIISNNIKRVLYENENYSLISEGVKWDNDGDYAVISVNSNGDDKSNLYGDMAVDTRVFGTKQDILHGDGTWISSKPLERKYYEKSDSIKFYKSVIEYIRNGKNGKLEDSIFLSNNIPKKTITSVKQWFEVGKSDNYMLDQSIKAINRLKLEFNPINNTYNRVLKSTDNEKTSRFITGYVPDTNVKYIALFSMKDFNFSDAIKHGYLRPNGNTDNLFGIDNDGRPKGNIPVKYDGNITPNIAQNFSLDNVKDGHYRQQYQYKGGKYNTSELGADDLQRELSKTKTYTSINQFIDKSIIYASYALKEENFSPDFIIPAPSSSKFNHYYCTNLSRKLGVEYIPDFFKRNAINVVFKEGDEEKMRQNGIPEDKIEDFKRQIKQIAFKEIYYYVHKPINDFMDKYMGLFSNLPIRKSSREKVDYSVVKKIILKYTSELLINMVKNNEDYVAKYIIAKLSKQNRLQSTIEQTLKKNSNNVNTMDYDSKFILNGFIEAMRQNGLHTEFKTALGKSNELVLQYSNILTKQGYRLRMDYQRAKITNFEKHLREYIHDLYIIADEHLTNGVLQKRFSNAKFLIFDEDINSGATLKLTIDALEDKLPSQNSNNIICLVNGYSSSGF